MPDTTDSLTLEDIDFLMGATLALWGDGALSKNEFALFYERLKSKNFEDSSSKGIIHRDLRDNDLTRKEYLLWVFDTVNLLKDKVDQEEKKIDQPQEMVLLELIVMYKAALKSDANLEVSKKERIEESKSFLKEVANSDSEFSDGEKKLLQLVDDNLRLSYWAENYGYWFWALVFVIIWKSCFGGEEAPESPEDSTSKQAIEEVIDDATGSDIEAENSLEPFQKDLEELEESFKDLLKF